MSDSDSVNAGQSVLVADVGGTNARFALADATTGAVIARQDFRSADPQLSGVGLITQALDAFGAQPAACVVAVAGPVRDGRGKLTNGHLEFDARELAEIGLWSTRVINDFEAVAYGVHADTAVAPLGDLREPTDGVRGVLGAGTGLGVGIVLPDGSVLPSEGGNADFAPGNEREAEVLGRLRARYGVVRWETLASGPGLVNLYEVLAAMAGRDVEPLEPADVVDQARDGEPLAVEVIDMFCAVLGACAGNLALTLAARGGIYLAGGIPPRIPEMLASSRFRERFEARGPLTHFVADIPTFLVTEPDPGLAGAIRCAQGLLTDLGLE
ncbi:MAG: glucokinase [Pseudomonadota bacterium]